jgi:hypothetical protein
MWAINWAGLSFASWLLLWLCISVTVLYVGLMTGLNIVETLSTRYGYDSSLKTFLNWRVRSTKMRRLVNRWLPRVGMLATGYILGQAQLFSPVREFHDVAVLQDNGDRQYTVSIPGHPKPILWKLCPDSDDLPLRTGMVMTLVQYKQEKGCQKFDAQTDVVYLRNAENRIVDREGKILFAKED